jgi:hypothetical protein
MLFSVRRADPGSTGIPIFLVDDVQHASLQRAVSFASISDELNFPRLRQ